jgi:Gly-Xaa carboxypeptidase
MGPVGVDQRWEVFGPFNDYLVQSFPLTYVTIHLWDDNKQRARPALYDSHQRLSLTKVNTYGLLYEWKGSDSNLKPLLLAAHQGLSARHARVAPSDTLE